MPEAGMIIAIGICVATLVSVTFLLFDPWARLRGPEQEALLSERSRFRPDTIDAMANEQEMEGLRQERDALKEMLAEKERAN